jgi:pimeloyl-ACP methyl ester carboxylesterase
MRLIFTTGHKYTIFILNMQPLLLLHGAIGASAQLKPLAECLKDHFTVYAPDFTGHGGNPIPETSLSMELFAADVLRFMELNGLKKVSVFGYSMGGYVGMYLVKHHPEKIDKVVTLATKYHWEEAIAAKEVQMLNPDKIEQKVPAFAEALGKLHAPADWKQLMNKTAEMMVNLGKDNPLKPADYATIIVPALILLGDRDKMVSLDETLAVFKALPNAQLGILPATPHPMEQVDPLLLSTLLVRFFDKT